MWVRFPPPVMNLRRIVEGHPLNSLGNTPGVALGWHWPIR
jgi:hypothetical protein